MTIPPIKGVHVVGTKHFVTGVIEDFLHGANLEHFLDMNLFKSAKKLPFADKEGEGSMAGFITIGIDIFSRYRNSFPYFRRMSANGNAGRCFARLERRR